VPGRMKIEDVQRASVDQIARRMFAVAKYRGSRPASSFNFGDVWGSVIEGTLSPELQVKARDAFYRLVDRNLVRWDEGESAEKAYYTLTERGRSSRFDEGVLDDPEPFIGDVEGRIGRSLDPVAKEYLREAVAAYHDGRLLSAQFCLGAVAERLAFLARDWLAHMIADGGKLKKKDMVGQVVSALPAALLELRKNRPEWTNQIDALGDCLASCADVYRRTRNEVGHPTQVREIDEDEVAMMMSAMRRLYIPAVYGLVVLAP
jgi:hypothetical protein